MTIDLYVMNLSPPCRAVLMAVKQLNLTVNIKQIDLRKGEHLTPEYLKINPVHTVPTLVDDGFALWESRAILQYLSSKYGANTSLYPTDLQKRAVVDRTLNFDMSLNSSVSTAVTMKLFRGTEPTEAQVKSFQSNLKTLDQLIGHNKYAAGSALTIADLSLVATLSVLFATENKELKEVPNVVKYYEGLKKELPYYNEVNGGLAEAFKQF
ncbi:unnamed protein product, partial [Oppiella nova]